MDAGWGMVACGRVHGSLLLPLDSSSLFPNRFSWEWIEGLYPSSCNRNLFESIISRKKRACVIESHDSMSSEEADAVLPRRAMMTESATALLASWVVMLSGGCSGSPALLPAQLH